MNDKEDFNSSDITVYVYKKGDNYYFNKSGCSEGTAIGLILERLNKSKNELEEDTKLTIFHKVLMWFGIKK